VKLKQRIGDFKVRELLADGYLTERGDHVVYRVTKRKMTTPEAVDVLAHEAGVEAGEVSIAGLKDRQGVTIQHMTVPGGRVASLREKELLIEPIGRAREALTSEESLGNAFEIVVRDLDARAVSTLRRNLPVVREHGVINFFDEQRFGNVKHGQGWIARDLMKGDVEKALKQMLTARSMRDDDRRRRFKERVHACWGDWRECRDEAGRFGQYHSVFEHLGKTDDDFAGAFGRVAMRIRLIHLYAWQSHLWNRAASELVRRVMPVEKRIVLESIEGSLVTFAGDAGDLARHPVMRLPGDGLEDVTDPLHRELFEQELAREGLRPDEFRIENVPGFQLKGEDRPLVVVPNHLRVRPAEPDPLADPRSRAKLVRVRFELPRGAYATLVVKRLFGEPVGSRGAEPKDEGPPREHVERARRNDHYQRATEPHRRGGGRRDERGGARGSDRRDDRGGHRGSDRRDDRGGYRGSNQRDDRGGYRGSNQGGDRGGDRGSNQRDDRGGYRGSNQRDDRGGYRGSNQGGDRGGYRGSNQGGDRGGYRGSNQGGDRGGYRGSNQRDDRGGYRGSSQGDDRGGYRGANQGGDRGGYRGSNQRDDRGGYRGSNQGGDRGGYRGSNQRDDRGGYRGSNQGGDRGGYRGSNQRDDRGGYRGSNQRDDRGGYRGSNQGHDRGGYRGSSQGGDRGGYRGSNQRDDRGGDRGSNPHGAAGAKRGYGRGRQGGDRSAPRGEREHRSGESPRENQERNESR